MKLIRKIMLLPWLAIAFLVFVSSIKDQIIIDSEIKKYINVIFPEGWSFFTKDPRSLVLDVYKSEKDTLIHIDMRNMSTINYLGLSRKSRIMGYEASILTHIAQTDA